jgi:Fatty acid desaturase
MASAILSTRGTRGTRPKAILRFGGWDGLFVLLAGIQGILVFEFPSAPVIAAGLWWNANTISHNFIHRPFFRSRAVNLIFSIYLSVLLGFPQSVWRDRHLAHHGNARPHRRMTPQVGVESLLILILWMSLAIWSPLFFLFTYLPGYFAGLGLCALQGHYEHTPVTTSHYGAIYNLLCFNDGYHVEHHASPAIHWRNLPRRMERSVNSSRWPPLLRWLDGLNLENLERLVLRSPILQQAVLSCHRSAFRALVPNVAVANRIAIVGGGLFPRTALILMEMLPAAEITIIDANAENLERARTILSSRRGEACGRLKFVNEWFVGTESLDYDLVVIPLALKGDRTALYHQPRLPVVVHDWIWRPRGVSKVVSLFLLKRINLVMP